MKLTMKIFLVISLFCTTALADGDMGEGSRDGSNGGGLVCVGCVNNEQPESPSEKASLLEIFRGMFGNIFG